MEGSQGPIACHRRTQGIGSPQAGCLPSSSSNIGEPQKCTPGRDIPTQATRACTRNGDLTVPYREGEREEFGHRRTKCSCAACQQYCVSVPGMLIPADIPRIARSGGVAVYDGGGDLNLARLADWAKTWLLASPGALIWRFHRSDPMRVSEFRIPTIVPAVRLGVSTGNACVWYDRTNGMCGIHADAPYGCAFFDDHMGTSDADKRSRDGLQAIMDDWKRGGLYSRLWGYLDRQGCVARPPEHLRTGEM